MQRIITTALFGVLTLIPARAGTVNVITNGTFEGGNITGWSTSSSPYFNTTGSCNSGWAAQNTASGCGTGLNPVFGSYAAYSSASFPAVGNNVGELDNFIRQTFVVPTGPITSAILTWNDSVVWSGSGTFRGVDLYTVLSFGTSFYSISNPASNGSLPWTAESMDVTSILQAHQGQTVTIEFGALTFYDTRGSGSYSSATVANYGIDNVQLNVTTTNATPEPSTFGLAGIALAALWGKARKLRR